MEPTPIGFRHCLLLVFLICCRLGDKVGGMPSDAPVAVNGTGTTTETPKVLEAPTIADAGANFSIQLQNIPANVSVNLVIRYSTLDHHLLWIQGLNYSTYPGSQQFEWLVVDLDCRENDCDKPPIKILFDDERRLRKCFYNQSVLDENAFKSIDPVNETRHYFILNEMGILMAENFREACEHHPSAEKTKELLTRKRRNAEWAIVPGTHYCGPGDIYEPGMPPPLASKTDACCKNHDHCPNNIAAYGFKLGYQNRMPSTMSACSCDDEFFQCLRDVNSPVSNAIGLTFSDFARINCFIEEGGSLKIRAPESYYAKMH